ncbi:TRAP transporter fused permease subunit [Marinobacter salinexigens]|uniref:TRAP transporter fused permease subunit n=1 Tax=Marinobacter salinexigens TaxID=2919747 RepID=A0A5B0VE93_9GAMM|nr:TRAP transporter fused permease subunit [Marinobacter salinexigens]KAA1172311.1 TRAP transporter fused permease subunit [Marinobacter salinexigens]
MTSSQGVDAQTNTPETQAPKKGRLHGVGYWTALALGGLGLLMAINQTFHLKLLGFEPLGNSYLYYLIGIFLAAAFLCFPAWSGARDRISWYDWVLAVLALVSCGYLGYHGLTMINMGWEYMAPTEATVFSGILLVLVLEGVRRCGGWPLLFVSLFFGTYPLYADSMPGFLWGNEYELPELLRAHVIGVESVIGIPMQVVAQLVIGFVVFGAALTITGGGDFFMKFATALMGRSRGGPAKVSVLSSGILGSLSGSVISNILTTGPITIPTMKKTGYPAHYAGAVEACASTGGTLMPPVMGAVAFIMASFLGVAYAEIMIAAFLPALLFYLALLFQVDNYAARRGLEGLPESEIPSLKETLKEGWPYLLSLAMLIYMLLVMRIEAYAPYYASLVLLVVALFKRDYRMNLTRAKAFIMDLTTNVSNLVAILAGIGLVVGGLSYTGVAGAFSRELLLYADGSIPLMLIAGAVTSFVLGMGMTVSACYIFLSILLAPALVNAGLNPLASHLFILYWGMLSYITPPVSLAAITAAGVAGSNATKTGVYAMRLGGILFILPFLFVLNPSLILQGDIERILMSAITAIAAIWLIASAMEGYLYRVGIIGWPLRVLALIAGGLLIYPDAISEMLGVGVIVAIYAGKKLFGSATLPARNH